MRHFADPLTSVQSRLRQRQHARLFDLQHQQDIQSALNDEFEEIAVVSPYFARQFQASADASLRVCSDTDRPCEAPPRRAFWLRRQR
ncbi:hypothetical protein VK792_04745 [Mesobacterium sp. TK19101]|uniref:Uncharacterized protein n=1 Tax=Mesobacterium hydrothermale TaxID=3111907 RepID=A0ABU6HDP8_9RHOB|nr:hypothetical protein [Mesobacterium sp. TK19101]MEC3860582.1 hypothetical protein [Mesobacterium sp. TK19101]